MQLARAVPQKAFVLLVRYLSADQSFDPAAFRRVTYAQRKQLLFSVPTISGAAGFNQALVRTTAIWGLSYTNLNHAGLIGGQDSSASKSTLNSASKNSIVAGWLSSDASRVDSSAHSNRRSRVNGKMILPKSVCLKSPPPQVFRVLPNEISLRSSRTYELCHLGLQPTFARNGTSSKRGLSTKFCTKRTLIHF